MYVMALVTIRRSPSVQTTRNSDEIEIARSENDIASRSSRSLNECYFANKGAALVLGGAERGPGRGRGRRRSPAAARTFQQPDIQHHLQSMFYLIRPEETLKMAVKLESAHAGRTRYLVVVCRGEEAALLGIDCNERTTVGLVLRVLADTSIKLDGDGGFSVCVCNQQHIFKPVSVQAMWSALQTLHRASARARELNHFAGGASHAWCGYYEQRVDSDRSCLNEWHAMDCLESRRPPSPDSLRLKPREREETERVIRCTLKEIMMSVDLDEVTSKAIRGRLEDELDMDLAEYKSFIDQEMLTILGQMDAPTEIFEHVYLGSEWNASNLEELQRNGVRHILNVTREIDNFFPGMFDYLNIRVYDDEKTDLLKHWDNTYKYINKARNEGSKVLVHCKMGISRSASVVIAYAMKAYNWNFDKALKHVKAKRNCIKPNNNFLNQLETYQGILDAMKNKEKLQRSKSETNLKSPKTTSKTESKMEAERARLAMALAGESARPRSWSPDTKLASELLPPTSVSLENLAFETRHMLMPCANGSYSVSPNQIIRLKEEGAPSVKHIINEIENAASIEKRDFIKKHQRLNFGVQGDLPSEKEADVPVGWIHQNEVTGKPPQPSPSRHASLKYALQPNKIPPWDPGDLLRVKTERQKSSEIDKIVKSDSGIVDVKVKGNDNVTLIERNLEYEDRKFGEEESPPSRQSSSSSFDSAVMTDLSRQSSWCSYDTRTIRSHGHSLSRDDVIRRSKERSEDCGSRGEDSKSESSSQRPTSDLGIITEHKESRKSWRRPDRAPGEISENERKFNETCAILKELASAAARIERRGGGASTWSGRLSASAPADTWLRACLRRRRLAAASHGDLSRSTPAAAPSTLVAPASVTSAVGIVSNLKKEFEARSESDALHPAKSKTRITPAEPQERPASMPPSGEDLSVKVLVDRYDQPLRARSESKGSHEIVKKKYKLGTSGESESRETRASAALLRNSFCGAVRGERPLAPTVVSLAPIDYTNVVVSTVMSKAQTKKQLQHGKTHPLTRLNLSRSNNKCSNPVYNTM